jgi:MerR family transcriptional regulator, light-induced transcriptional regulator
MSAGYSITDLEKLSGIKAHTLRIWEQRYNLINPQRSLTKIRKYNTEDLKFILNVAQLKDHGYKISKIAKFTPQQIQEAVMAISDKQMNFPDQIQAFTTAMLEFDESRFEHLLDVNIQKFGFESVMVNIIYPFLTRIGTLWVTGSIGPALEHFMTNLLRQKIVVATEKLPKVLKDNHKTFILYLPDGEYHEIGLQFAQYLIKSRKHRVIYFGQSLPKDDALFIFNNFKPDYVFTSITSSPDSNQIQKYIHWMEQNFLNTPILLTGYQVIYNPIITGPNTKIMGNVSDLLNLLETAEA